MKNVTIFGSNGLLGQSLVKKFIDSYRITGTSVERENYNPYLPITDYIQLDITDRASVKKYISTFKPDIIINAAAFTNVDACESEVDLCWEVNSNSLEIIVEACSFYLPLLVQISTDYVFDGRSAPYNEKDKPNPEGKYGKSKLAAERAIFDSKLDYIIARTQVLYGTGIKVKNNFALWVIEKLKNKETIHVVDDQVGNPTFVDDLSEAIFRLIEAEEYGLFHVSGQESCSRLEFALAIAKLFNFDNSLIQPAKTNQLKQKAPRPMNSTFILDKLYNRINWLPSNVENGLIRLKKQLEK